MRIISGAMILLLMSGSSAFAFQSEDEKDRVIQDLQQKLEALEKRLDDLDGGAEPARSAGIETRIDEVIHQSPSEVLNEP